MSRLAVVVGAASGIGRATVERLARDGHRVVAADIAADGLRALAKAHGASVRTEQLDASQWDAVARFAEGVLAVDGVPDYVVPAAGINPIAESTGSIDEAFFDRLNAVNVKGLFAVCRFFLPAMAERGSGSVVNLASVSSFIGWGDSSVYVATKGAVLSLTRALAIEYASSGIRVNCVCPGSVRTPMVLNNLAVHGEGEAGIERVGGLHPLGRVGEPEEIADAIAFLLGDEASFITGTALTIDGGLTAI